MTCKLLLPFSYCRCYWLWGRLYGLITFFFLLIYCCQIFVFTFLSHSSLKTYTHSDVHTEILPFDIIIVWFTATIPLSNQFKYYVIFNASLVSPPFVEEMKGSIRWSLISWWTAAAYKWKRSLNNLPVRFFFFFLSSLFLEPFLSTRPVSL